MALDPIDPDISQDPTSVSDGEIKTLSNHEVDELNKLRHSARIFRHRAASVVEALIEVLSLSGISANGSRGVLGRAVDFGGHSFQECLPAWPQWPGYAEEISYEATKRQNRLLLPPRTGLDLPEQLRQGEINQIQKQIRGAQIREAIAQKEYTNHQAQMANAQQIVDFLQGKIRRGLPDQGDDHRLLCVDEA